MKIYCNVKHQRKINLKYMEKQAKNILSRIKKINKIIQQPSINNKDNNELLKKTMISLERILKYIKNK